MVTGWRSSRTSFPDTFHNRHSIVCIFFVLFQGKIHLEVNFDRNRIDDSVERLRLEIFEACDLTMVNTSCDPFVEVTVKFTNGKQETHRTKVKKKTNCPSFHEEFIFSVSTLFGPESAYTLMTDSSIFALRGQLTFRIKSSGTPGNCDLF